MCKAIRRQKTTVSPSNWMIAGSIIQKWSGPMYSHLHTWYQIPQGYRQKIVLYTLAWYNSDRAESEAVRKREILKQ